MSAGSGRPPPAGRGGRTKSGKPRPGTGGRGRRRLEGKGPTPPAHLRPGHPAQRRAAQEGQARPAGTPAGGPSRARMRQERARPADGPPGPRSAEATRARGAGEAPEMVAGRNAVLEALRAGVPATALYAGPRADADQRVREAIELAARAGIAMVEVGHAELDRITKGSVHQGLALRVRPYDYVHPADLTARALAAGQVPLIVAMDGVTDPRNLGAIVRSAAAFGAHGVLIPARRSARVTAGAWKASAGTLARVPVAQAPNLVRALASYQEAGLFVAGLDASGPVDISGLDLATQPLVVVVGSEGRGLSRLVAEHCDVLVRIPIFSGAESLNAGVAAGIALHEVAARRAAES